MDHLQYFPTPPALALRMVETFTDKPWGSDARVLEPSAGDGALVRALVCKAHKMEDELLAGLEPKFQERRSWGYSKLKVDFIEMDFAKHPVLKAIEGVEGDVVGLDFLQYGGSLSAWTHILMNPPFRDGVHHLLKAWDGMFDGEIVCLLNAETLRNAFSKERQHLARIIDQHGRVEFIEGAFAGGDARRKTDVEVAIVHLTKRANVEQEYLQGLFDGLDADRMGATGIADMHIPSGCEIAIPADVIDRTVLAFQAAVRAMRESVAAEYRASYTESLLGKTLAQRDDKEGPKGKAISVGKDAIQKIRADLASRYEGLKDRAWSEVLRSTECTSRLSSKAQKRLESSFETIKRLDFSKANVLSFLIGLIESQSEMNVEMALDCFDEITRYHSENVVFFMGWKSNDRHRTAGWRIKTTRFILPRFEASFGNSLYFEQVRRLADFDKVFATLDGKDVTQVLGMADLFNGPRSKEFTQQLYASKRVRSEFFDVRWFPKRGTIHFFPRRQDLVDRLNRLVGRHREWLPPQDDLVSDDFWLAYEQGEKFGEEVEKRACASTSSWGKPTDRIFSNDPDEASAANGKVAHALLDVLHEHAIHPLSQLSHESCVSVPRLQLAA